MHSSVLLAGFTWATIALGLTTGPILGKRFSVPNSQTEEGFTTPKRVQEGIYEVHIDEKGTGHYVQINSSSSTLVEPLFSAEDLAKFEAGGQSTDVSIAARQDTNGDRRKITCGSWQEMNHQWADEAVSDLIWQCGGGLRVKAGHHIYSVRGHVAAFFCNYNWPIYFKEETCWGANVRKIIVEQIGNRCGPYRPGWSESSLAQDNTGIGQHEVGSDKSFCGETYH